MTFTPSRLIGSGVLTLALATALTGGTVAATTEPPNPAPTEAMTDSSAAPGATVEMTPECAAIVAILDAQTDLTNAFLAEDGVALGAVLESLPGLAAAARADAPAEIADAVAVFVGPGADLSEIFAGVDMTDFDAIVETLSSLPPEVDTSDAQAEVEAWAAENCGWSSSFEDPFADAPEPPECDVLDPAVAADAAGADVDVTDSDGGGDFNLPGFWTKSCSYGNGAMALSTLSFTGIDQVTEFYLDNLSDTGGNVGTVLDVDLGTLPASTLVTEVDGMVTVSVFEAPIPFSVAFSDDSIDPASVVAAAEALLAAQPADGAAPASTATASTQG